MTKEKALDFWYDTLKIQAESVEEEILAYARVILQADRERLAQLECIHCLDYIKKASPLAVPAEYIEASAEWIHFYRDPTRVVRARAICRGSAIRNLPIFDPE